MGKWTIHQHHYPKGKSMNPFSILELLTHEGITHFPICLRGLTLSKITTLLTHHKNNRKVFCPFRRRLGALRLHTQSVVSVSAAAPAPLALRNVRPDGENEGFGFTEPSQQELETCVTRARLASAQHLLHESMKRRQTCFRRSSLLPPVPERNATVIDPLRQRIQRSEEPNVQSKHS